MRTIDQAAKKWGKSRALIQKWIKQGRLKTIRPSRDIFVLDENPPEPAKRGSLSAFQRKAWKR